MEDKKSIPVVRDDVDKSLLYALERGIDDVENGQELPLKEAMSKVREIRLRREQIRA